MQDSQAGVLYPAPAAIGRPVVALTVESPKRTTALFAAGVTTCIHLARVVVSVEIQTFAAVPVNVATVWILAAPGTSASRIRKAKRFMRAIIPRLCRYTESSSTVFERAIAM